jgi:hypothetical protein
MPKELSAQQQAILSEVCDVVSNSVSVHADIAVDEVNFEDQVKDLFDNNLYRFGHMLMDVHEIYELKMSYEPLTEFDTFATISDVVRYFFNQVLIKQESAE